MFIFHSLIIWTFPFSSESIPLSHKADDPGWPQLQHAEFTTKGHALIIVYNYDIYYRLGPRTYQSFRVTDDAIPGIVYNGIPDWLYEGEYLCWLRLNGGRIVGGNHRHIHIQFSWRQLTNQFYVEMWYIWFMCNFAQSTTTRTGCDLILIIFPF